MDGIPKVLATFQAAEKDKEHADPHVRHASKVKNSRHWSQKPYRSTHAESIEDKKNPCSRPCLSSNFQHGKETSPMGSGI